MQQWRVVLVQQLEQEGILFGTVQAEDVVANQLVNEVLAQLRADLECIDA